MPATQSDIDGLKAANDGLAFALRNCERAARGDRPLSSKEDIASQLGDLFAAARANPGPFCP